MTALEIAKREAESWVSEAESCSPEALNLAQQFLEALEVLKNVLPMVEEFRNFHDGRKKPCGEYGVECPISMGEWFGESERHMIAGARAFLDGKTP